MHVRRWARKETNLTIKCDDEAAIDAIIEASARARNEIERFIFKYPGFRWALEPLRLSGEHPRVIDLMLRAGELADVGPFAAVAGAISQVGAEAGLRAGAENVVVENGGDIAIAGDRDFRVGIFAGSARGSGKIGLLIREGELPAGICTSSGTVGHSISLGWADAAVVIAKEASVADAAATSIANAVSGTDVETSIEKGLERARQIPEIRGCLILREGYIGAWGKLPKLIQLPPGSEEILTTGRRYQKYGAGLPTFYTDRFNSWSGEPDDNRKVLRQF